MKPYEWKIKTDYLKNKIRGQSLDKLNYVKDLVMLEYFVLNPPKNWISGMYFESLKSAYINDFEQILKELDLNKFQEYKNEKNRRRKLEQEQQLRRRSKEKLIRTWWVKHGGNV